MVSEAQIRELILDHEDPFVTASEIGEQLGVARQTAHKYLQRMHENGDLEKQKVGGSAVIWWLPERVD